MVGPDRNTEVNFRLGKGFAERKGSVAGDGNRYGDWNGERTGDEDWNGGPIIRIVMDINMLLAVDFSGAMATRPLIAIAAIAVVASMIVVARFPLVLFPRVVMAVFLAITVAFPATVPVIRPADSGQEEKREKLSCKLLRGLVPISGKGDEGMQDKALGADGGLIEDQAKLEF